MSTDKSTSDKKIHSVLWFLTRKCNLACSYCNITRQSRVYDNTVLKTSVPIDLAIESLKRIKKHNPSAFHIFMGGEPTLYKHLEELLTFCNEQDICYAIISNMTEGPYKRIKKLLDKGIGIYSLTGTIDTCVFDPLADKNDDRYKKSKQALEYLTEFAQHKLVKEVVAEVCFTNKDFTVLEKTLQELSARNIYADIFPIETAFNEYYDFTANVSFSDLVKPTEEVTNTLLRIYEKSKSGEFLIIGNEVIRFMIEHLPHHYKCNIPTRFSVLTIDSDGSLRLCIRIKGTECEKLSLTVPDILDKRGRIKKRSSNLLTKAMLKDKQFYCFGCMWTCAMFSDLVDSGAMTFDKVNHAK